MAPLVANYYLTYRCNARCHFCNIWALEPGKEADFETIKQNLNDLRRLGVKYVDFTGGEPLLRQDVGQIYIEAKRQGFYTSMTTNTILYPKKAKEIQGLVDFLNFSLDGSDAETHDHSRGVKIFDNLVESVALAKSLGEFPVLNHTVTAQNYGRIDEVGELGQKLGTRVWLNPAFTAYENYNLNKNPTPEMVAAIEATAKKYKNVGYNKAALAFIEAGGNDTKNPRCKAVDAVIAISPNDELLLPCYHFAQTGVPINGRLYELYRQSEEVESYRQSQGKLKVCEGCTVWCYLIPSFFMGVDKYWWLNQVTYASEFLARNDSYNEFDPLNSLFSELSANEESVEEASNSMSLPSRFQGRRRKAALVLTIVWSGTFALHLVSWSFLFVIGLTTVIGIHALVLVFTKPRLQSLEMQGHWPYVSVLVAAKNEEAVIGNLVKNLCSLEYPEDRYEVWIVDDNSTDSTPQLLAALAQEYHQLKVLRRDSKATGGKSGALNQVLPLSTGEIVAVFDADARVEEDLLLRVIPLFQREKVGAVQVRKAIANAQENFWTKGQMVEMAVDTFFQQQRTAIGGIGELRGNGQFVRRKALVDCGGWNEETITDDLDLTIRLHLNSWDIECVFYPTVEEEGVTSAIALWHQRSRWAEGGYQRYLDYWDLILRNRMGTRKTWNLFIFLLIMYILPTAAVPDLLMALTRHRPPILSPVSGLTVTMSIAGMFAGLRRIRQNQEFKLSTYFLLLFQTLRGTLYMFHWIVVISTTTARMSVRPKRLKWVKTLHTGSG